MHHALVQCSRDIPRDYPIVHAEPAEWAMCARVFYVIGDKEFVSTDEMRRNVDYAIKRWYQSLTSNGIVRGIVRNLICIYL